MGFKEIHVICGSQGWEFAHRFFQRITRFCEKKSKWANRSKNELFTNLLIFGERFAHSCSFLVSNLLTVTHCSEQSDRSSHCSLKRGSEPTLVFLNLQKYYFIQKFFSNSLRKNKWFAHGCSFLVSNLSDSLTVALLSWAIWANCSQSLFKMSNFEQKSDERMREFPTLVVSLGAKWRNKINLIQNPIRATHLKVLFSKNSRGQNIKNKKIYFYNIVVQ